MTRQILAAFVAEGTTDRRFLESIIQRSFEEAAFECRGQIEILPVQYIKKESGYEFIEAVKKCAAQARNIGVMILCVHVDADNSDDNNAFQNKINPAFQRIKNLPSETFCNNLVAIVPVQMTEAWMLADTNLLKDEIGTDKSDIELGLHKKIEDYNDPKETIRNAIRIARRKETRRRRRNLKIEELYMPIGRKLDLKILARVHSYQKFLNAIRNAYRKMNYLD